MISRYRCLTRRDGSVLSVWAGRVLGEPDEHGVHVQLLVVLRHLRLVRASRLLVTFALSRARSFAHHRVTIPPSGWTTAAHRQGVKMLGTLCAGLHRTDHSPHKYTQNLRARRRPARHPAPPPRPPPFLHLLVVLGPITSWAAALSALRPRARRARAPAWLRRLSPQRRGASRRRARPGAYARGVDRAPARGAACARGCVCRSYLVRACAERDRQGRR
jgi:hypothetical protein